MEKRKNFTIAKYFQKHSEAHNDFETANKDLTNGMKITYFIQGLKEKNPMNFDISSKSEANVNTFEEFYNSFSAKLSTKITLSKNHQASSTRQISATSSSNNNDQNERNSISGNDGQINSGDSYRGGRGGGRYPSGGRYNGSRGRGRGRGLKRKYQHTAYGCRGWRPQNRDYSNEEWSQLSHEQKQRIYDIRNSCKDNRNGRQISQLNTDESTLPSHVQLPSTPSLSNPSSTPTSNNSIRSQGGRAGDAFSQRRNNGHNGNNR